MLKIGCFVALVFCALVALQWAGIVPPLGLGWGDGNRRGGTGYSLGLVNGSPFFETLSGVQPWAPGTGGRTGGAMESRAAPGEGSPRNESRGGGEPPVRSRGGRFCC